MIENLVDRDALAIMRRRARASFPIDGSLYELAALELRERINGFDNREFRDVTVISGQPDFWQQVFPQAMHIPDDDMLDIAPDSQDLVLHCLSLHWSNDLVGQLIQCRNSLKPGGLFLGTLFGGDTLLELKDSIVRAESLARGGISPRILPLADVRSLGDLLPRVGLAQGVADRVQIRKRYESTVDLMHEIRSLGETNAMSHRVRNFSPRSMFMYLEHCYQESHSTDDGKLFATFEFMFLTGWCSNPSVQSFP